MKKAIITSSLKGYTVEIEGKTKKRKGGLLKQMAEILELSAAGFRVFDNKGEELTMC